MSRTQYQAGDLVEAAKGETVIRGRLVATSSPHHIIVWPHQPNGSTTYIEAYESDGFTVTVIEKAKPQLPTEPGYYECEGFPIARNFSAYRLDDEGEWWMDKQSMSLPYMADRMPLTRLAPVAETAMNVLNRVANFWEFGPPPSVTAELNAIAIEFGAES